MLGPSTKHVKQGDTAMMNNRYARLAKLARAAKYARLARVF
jgi:hypothetical protein